MSALERLAGMVRGWPADDGGSCLVEAHDVMAVIASHERLRAALTDMLAVLGEIPLPDCPAMIRGLAATAKARDAIAEATAASSVGTTAKPE